MPSVIRGSDLFDTKTAIGLSTNHNAATGTVTIPSGLEIGTRRLIRKIHPTQGTVTINCTGETFTRAGLASVELNADGDYWLLEKVTATRWELIDGFNTGQNANESWRLLASGQMDCEKIVDITTTVNISAGALFFSGSLFNGGVFPKVFVGIPSCWLNIRGPYNALLGQYGDVSNTHWGEWYHLSDFARPSATYKYQLYAIGRWYL